MHKQADVPSAHVVRWSILSSFVHVGIESLALRGGRLYLFDHCLEPVSMSHRRLTYSAVDGVLKAPPTKLLAVACLMRSIMRQNNLFNQMRSCCIRPTTNLVGGAHSFVETQKYLGPSSSPRRKMRPGRHYCHREGGPNYRNVQ